MKIKARLAKTSIRTTSVQCYLDEGALWCESVPSFMTDFFPLSAVAPLTPSRRGPYLTAGSRGTVVENVTERRGFLFFNIIFNFHIKYIVLVFCL